MSVKKNTAKQIVAAFVKEYGLDIENCPDITDPAVARKVDEEIARQCRPIFEMWAQIEAASMANAHKIWVGALCA